HLILPGFKFEMLAQGEFSRDSFKMLSEDIKQAKEEVLSLKGKEELIDGKIFEALISKVKKDRVQILTPFGIKTLLLEDFSWAIPVAKKSTQNSLKDARKIFKANDIISIKIKVEKSAKEKTKILAELYQEPLVQGALLSLDLETDEVLALVGGYDYGRSQFNRTYQARRQPGSVFKPFIYGAALERGFTPASVISDSPVVFTDEEAEEKVAAQQVEVEDLEEEDIWKPTNISQRFSGEILFRTALVRSLNVPTVKVIEKTGLDWVRFYVRQLGIFSPLNSDFTMALGSSALTLYELLKSFSVFPRGGKQIRPLMIHRVEDRFSEVLMTDVGLDEFFVENMETTREFVQEEKRSWFARLKNSPKNQLWLKNIEMNSDQLIPEESSFIVNNLLEAVISDKEGTARRARFLNRPLAGKTGTTNGYYDAWFMGYSPFISTGVWVGFDTEKTLGRGETGSRSALPVWIDYMRAAHKDLPNTGFSIPENIVFINMDKETGGLVSSETQFPVRQAFVEGTEPDSIIYKEAESPEEEVVEEEESDFIKGNL
ncbi:MAG: penicillin-binding transpeptidase domain-containing protein, partial [Bdellovibrionales bacterium]